MKMFFFVMRIMRCMLLKTDCIKFIKLVSGGRRQDSTGVSMNFFRCVNRIKWHASFLKNLFKNDVIWYGLVYVLMKICLKKVLK